MRVPADPDALSDPDRAGSQQASQFAGPRQVGPLVRAQREVLVVTRQEADRVTAVAAVRGRQQRASGYGGPGDDDAIRRRKPVIRVRPGRRLLGVIPGRADARGKVG
jgi:hypothetical protein